jgi:DNA anti-recombination protein RmuC
MSDLDIAKVIRIEDDINTLKVELGSLKEKVSFFNVIYGKFDDTLSKVQAVMEDRRSETNEDLREVYQKIQDTENKIMGEIKALRAEMTTSRESENGKINSKIESLDKWRWQMMGAAAVIGFLLSKAADFLK